MPLTWFTFFALMFFTSSVNTRKLAAVRMERAVVHERHAEALDRPDGEQERRERKLAARADDLSGRRGEAHDDKADERARKAAGDRPLAPDLLRDRPGCGKADNGGDAAEDCEDHCSA